MSRVGKLPIELPQGVKAAIQAGMVIIEGPKGNHSMRVNPGIEVVVEGNALKVSRSSEDEQTRANHGTVRALLNNMVQGVAKGWSRSLEINGVGYNATVAGQTLTLVVGFSHDVKLAIPAGVKCVVNKNVIVLDSADRHAVGQFAARIRRVRKPEPYLGKGIKYLEEKIRRKAGKIVKK